MQQEFEEWFGAKEMKQLSKAELRELYHKTKINELRLINRLREAERKLQKRG